MSNIVNMPGVGPVERDATPLAPQWHRFAEEYLIDFKPMAAARRAGVDPRQVENGLRDPRVMALIAEGRKKRSEQVAVSVSNVLQTLSVIARADVMDYFKYEEPAFPGGPRRLRLDLENLTDDQRAAIKSIKWTINGPAIELFDKVAATVQIGKFFNIWTDGIALTNPAAGLGTALIDANMTPEQAMELYQRTLNP